MIEVALTNEEKVKITCAPTTAAGRPATLDGPVTARLISGEGSWEAVEGDALSVWLVTGDDPGDAQYVVEADADLGSGVETISDVVTLHVAGASAANMGLSAGTPVLK